MTHEKLVKSHHSLDFLTIAISRFFECIAKTHFWTKFFDCVSILSVLVGNNCIVLAVAFMKHFIYYQTRDHRKRKCLHKFEVAKDYQGCNLLNDKNMLN